MTFYTGKVVGYTALTDDLVIFVETYDRKEYNIIPSSSANYVNVLADPNSSKTSGKLYVTASDGFFIIDLATKNIIYKVTPDISTLSDETLTQSDIVDLNIGG